MKPKLIVIAGCVIAMFFLSGCKVAKENSLGSSGSGFSSSGLPAGGGIDGGGSIPLDPGGSPSDPGGIPGIGHNPEPATVALLGGGLITYALLRRRNKK